MTQPSVPLDAPPPETLAEQLPIPRMRRRYPWDEWADGRTRRLIEGEHFSGGAAAFRNRCYAVAAKRGMKATVRACLRNDGRMELHLRFYRAG